MISTSSSGEGEGRGGPTWSLRATPMVLLISRYSRNKRCVADIVDCLLRRVARGKTPAQSILMAIIYHVCDHSTDVEPYLMQLFQRNGAVWAELFGCEQLSLTE